MVRRMRYPNLIFQWLASIWDVIRGPRILREITKPHMLVESLVGYSLNGYVITIHCQERKYRYEYKYRHIRDKAIYSYFVFATVTGSAPEKLVNACNMERAFPKLLPFWMPSETQKEAAIEAYLDLLIEKLDDGRQI